MFGGHGNHGASGRSARRTSAEAVFAELHRRIVTLSLMPGDRISESEVAAEFGVSRQPVRDAFARLASGGYIEVRPQKATVVTPFSLSAIADARFVRLAVEAEVVRELALARTPMDAAREIVARQGAACEAVDAALFHELDDAFHGALCAAAGREGAARTVFEMKQQVDRLCLLSMGNHDEMVALRADHAAILDAVEAGAPEAALAALRRHLGRLDEVVGEVRAAHPHHFAD